MATTSQGPVRCPSCTTAPRNLNAFFLVDTQAAQAALDAAGAGSPQATCNWGGEDPAAPACYEYQDTSIGVYNEIGLAVPWWCGPGSNPA